VSDKSSHFFGYLLWGSVHAFRPDPELLFVLVTSPAFSVALVLSVLDKLPHPIRLVFYLEVFTGLLEHCPIIFEHRVFGWNTVPTGAFSTLEGCATHWAVSSYLFFFLFLELLTLIELLSAIIQLGGDYILWKAVGL
jgi:hypothetical protein